MLGRIPIGCWTDTFSEGMGKVIEGVKVISYDKNVGLEGPRSA
jgi:hypothetical protein